MTTPVWMLLGFAAWTALLLLFTVGIYRWSRIFTGRVAIRNFPADAAGGQDWYRRATRAHANCIENLPVFGAIVFGLYAGNVTGPLVDVLAVTILVARILPIAGARVFRPFEQRCVLAVRFLLRAVHLLLLADGNHRANAAGLVGVRNCVVTKRRDSGIRRSKELTN